ncbi:hypothetical protein [Parafrankia sp. FMc2]|uniref:hypothetical protein n=1 Tax=Parafrankia sp. FMc2 TaxID=3233196 RepID=UPI0034D5E14B
MGSDGKTAHQYHTIGPTLLDEQAPPAVLAGPLSPTDAGAGGQAVETAAAGGPAGEPAPPAQPAPDLPVPSAMPEASTATDPPATTLSGAGPAEFPAETTPAGATPADTQPADAVPAGDEPLTPIPEMIPRGDPLGVPLLVGGADLDDSQATLLAYDSPQGPREVLVATVTPDAEAKLLDALTSTPMIEIHTEEQTSTRLALDTDGHLFEQLATVAKSINHHATAGDDIPAHTYANFATVAAQLDALTDADTDAGHAEMLEHYRAHAAAIEASLHGGGGKVPHVTAFEQVGSRTVTRLVPDPDALDPGPTVTVRPATRPAVVLDSDGVAHWNGADRTPAEQGQEYALDLGDGYTAVYRPHATTHDLTDLPQHSQRGRLEIVAPPGNGHGTDLVDKLGDLQLVNRTMTAAEGEWSYLRRQVWAQDLDAHPAVVQALHTAGDLDDATEHLLFAERAPQAMGLDERGLRTFARSLRLDAETRALPAKIGVLRDAVAQATGHTGGAALAASPGYDPHPRHSGRGWLRWDRFDVAADPAAVRARFGGRGLMHEIGSGNLHAIIRSGVLASTERRRLMGVTTGVGLSETADLNSGGANSVFLRVAETPASGPVLFWEDPSVLLRRADVYAYPLDNFGAEDRHEGYTRSPATMATFQHSSNEVMIRNGLDLLGAEAPSMIRCTTAAQRTQILSLLRDRKIEKLGGRLVEQVVVL